MKLEASHLSFAYVPGNTILHDVSLKINSGETLYILGQNGGGKTTLLSCLAGLLHPDTGDVQLGGKSLSEYSTSERARLIGSIPQMHVPVFAFTLQEMVLMGRAPYLGWMGTPSKNDQEIAERSLEQVGLFELRHRAFTEISGGEQQLVLIARGLAQNCQILLMDEPTTHLDLSNQHQVLEIVQQLSKRGLSFIIASHAPNDALSYADQVLLLNGGWVTAVGPPQKTITETSLSLIYGIDTELIYDVHNGARKAKAVVTRRPVRLSPESLTTPGNLLYDTLINAHESPQLILVTGLRGAGKTSWCSKLAKVAQEQGLNVSGILSPGIFTGKRKIGIAVKNLATGEQHQLAELRKGEFEGLSTPRWRFNPESMSWANDVLRYTIQNDLLIIDEIGPIELLRGEGLSAGIERIDHNQYKVACVVVRPSLVPTALQRWPHATVVSGYLE
ncbi:MAG: ATP-binding cassette domain-containing protein [Chloroflexota bacterium]|nr:ATP-binding cassette domain-containing protein [Chloroflexota bacterium]